MSGSKESFDVITDPWIPVRDSDGSTAVLGLWDVLSRAPELAEITDPSPMIEYGLYRLIATFLMDALRPEDVSGLQSILGAGCFDMEALESYIQQCRSEGVSFNLFDPERPFLQTPYRKAWDASSLRSSFYLSYALPSGNNHAHFVHQDSAEAISYDYAARLLPALQLFCTAAVQGYPSTINGTPPFYMITRESSLFATLVWAMAPREAFHNIPYDEPAVWWRSKQDVVAKQTVKSTSALFGMLFPARRVLLVPNNGVVEQVYFGPGMNFDKKLHTWRDPHVGYRTTKSGPSPWVPQHARPIWRNLSELAKNGNSSICLSTRRNAAFSGEVLGVQLYGVETQKASYLEGQRYDVALPAALSEKDEALDTALDLVADAQKVSTLLYMSFDKIKGIDESARQLCQQIFLDECEKPFWDMLLTLPPMDSAELQDERDKWQKMLVKFAWKTRRTIVDGVLLRGREIEKLEQSGCVLAKMLGSWLKKKGGKSNDKNDKKERKGSSDA